DAAGNGHGYVRDANGAITAFDPKGSVDTIPLSINASGAIVGTYETADKVDHAFLRTPDGKVSNIDPKQAVSGTQANKINDAGMIIGDFKAADGLSHG